MMDSMWAVIFMGIVFVVIALGFIFYDMYAKRSPKKYFSKRV